MAKTHRTLPDIVPDERALLSSLKAASFLNYNPVSFRRLVSQGKLEPRGRIGHYLVFAKEDLQHFRLTNVWAKKKLTPALAVAETALAISPKHKTPYATVSVESRTGNMDFEKIKNFDWAHVPGITKRVQDKFADSEFKIAVEMPTGAEYVVHFSPRLYSFAPGRLGQIVSEKPQKYTKRGK
jgi:hypothetical protein